MSSSEADDGKGKNEGKTKQPDERVVGAADRDAEARRQRRELRAPST